MNLVDKSYWMDRRDQLSASQACLEVLPLESFLESYRS